MTIKTIQQKVDDWIKQYGVRYFNELTNTAVLMEEVGEFSRLMARKYGEQSFKKEISDIEIKKKISEELSDIIFVVACLANQMDIDLETAFDRKLNIKSDRDKDRHKSNPKINNKKIHVV